MLMTVGEIQTGCSAFCQVTWPEKSCGRSWDLPHGMGLAEQFQIAVQYWATVTGKRL